MIAVLAPGVPVAGSPKPDPARLKLEVARIKGLLPAGEELAGAYTQTYDDGGKPTGIRLMKGEDYDQAVASSYLFADFNNDKIQDLAVAVEAAPGLDATGSPTFGRRALRVFLADASGQLQLFSTGAKVLLSADGGGMQGDPLTGFDQSRTGALKVTQSGGSSDRWVIVQTFQFRKDDFYAIGTTVTESSSLQEDSQTVDRNFLTGGQVIERIQGEKKPVVTRKQTPRKSLVKLTDAVLPAGWQ
jgi:hypothetical protein